MRLFIILLCLNWPAIQAEAPSIGCITADCFVRPCEFATCAAYPEATCVDNYCGGCFTDWFNGDTEVDFDIFPLASFLSSLGRAELHIRDGVSILIWAYVRNLFTAVA
ncbi:uncharacterized protein [Apostichopus japonicus]|uniref:uncharacterized protein isoform X1 n=1 Tax=Stichopus japonicus TaxID=307972 RepID=UPI003AB2780A